MFKKLLAKIKLWQAEQEHRRKEKAMRYKTELDYLFLRLRDKAIVYCCKLDSAKNNEVSLPPTHRVDTVLYELIKSEKDVIKYHKRFPYRQLAERLG